MWVVAGILLAVVVLGIVAGFHFGPHAHVPAAVAGVLLALWLVAMALLGYGRPLLYVLLGADVTITTLLGIGAVRVIRDPTAFADRDRPAGKIDGQMGTAETDLDPKGIVNVKGEQWSARSLNGNVKAGTPIQVIRSEGVTLEVWGESAEALPPVTPIQTLPNNEEAHS